MLPEHFEQCIEMSADAFLTRNAAVMHLQVPAERWHESATEKHRTCRDSGLSLVAIDDATGDIAAFLFINQFALFKDHKPTEPGLGQFYECGEKMYEQAIDAGKLSLSSLVRGKTMHVVMGGTSKEYEGTGSGMCLRAYVEKHAALHGFDSSLVEPAHPATRHIWEKKLGYTVCAMAPLADLTDKAGAMPFAGLSRSEQLAICEKAISRSGFWYSAWAMPLIVPAALLRRRPVFFYRYPVLTEAPEAKS